MNWKVIPGFEGLYEVSDCGRVRSLDRVVIHKNGRQQPVKGKLFNLNSDGRYYKVELKGKTYGIHQLVAMAFLDHKPCGHKIQVDHIDENKLNNHISNLQLVSASENQLKSVIHRRKNK